MDYITILFLLVAISIVIIFIVFYSYISKQINEYIIPLISLYNNTNTDTDTRVNQIKITMETLDKKQTSV
jgi:predicted PurR-regulated permease PerM